MQTRHDDRYEGDSTPSRHVVEKYRACFGSYNSEVHLALVSYRGGEEEFLLGKEYCGSSDSSDRAVGADILAQLGWSDQTFHEESIALLIPLLEDADDRVIYSAAAALGHRQATSAIPLLLTLVDHKSPLVRYGVVHGLSRHEDLRAIEGLIELSKDADRDVRNWAVFGLGSLIDADSAEIRDALKNALRDPDHEIRGEGLVGLARRKDSSVVPELLNEWRGDDISMLSIEAAEELGDSRLYHTLSRLAEILTLDDDPHFADKLSAATEACRPNIVS